MRIAFASLFSLASLAAAGCNVSTAEGVAPTPASNVAFAEPPTPPVVPPRAPPAALLPADEAVSHAEVVDVFMRKKFSAGTWMCTGALVGPQTVLTAGHCVDPTEFVSYEIVARHAPGTPRVQAVRGVVASSRFDDVANPDVGVLRLAEPVALATYAELTDVTADVLAGKALTAAAVVRTEATPEAGYVVSDAMPIADAAPLGYEHGWSTPMFSKGGDSGAGLFLVEDGKLTHKLVGVARQPEPERGIDHFTRVDASLLAWFSSATR